MFRRRVSPVSVRLLSLLPALLLTLTAVGAPLEIHDDSNRLLTLARPAQRIVSLAPGATAMLYAAGAGHSLVGTARFSDEPEAARSLPRVGDSGGFDLEQILALKPEVIVVWSGGMSEAQVRRLESVGLKVYRHQVQRLADLPSALERLGALAGTDAEARAAALRLRARLAGLQRQRAGQPSVLLQVWDQPIYTVGGQQLMSDAITSCGYRNAFGDLRTAGPAIGVESVLARNPEFIVAVAPSDALAAEWLARWRRFAALRAVRAQRLIGLADQRFSRLGPSAVDAAEELCRELDRH